MTSIQQRIIFFIILATILVTSGTLLAKPINLTTADIGRHIVNGRFFVATGEIPQGNLYSYTQPEFPFINHHWGSGVIFYLVHQIGGFNALSILYIALMLATIAIAFIIATNTSSPLVAAMASLPAIPLIASRGEVRPEAFSYFLIIIFLYLLWRYRAKASSSTSLVALPVLMLVWVNLHLFFIVGIGVIGAFFIDALFAYSRELENRKKAKELKVLGITLGASMLAMLINPAGIHGALLPLTISQNYGYRVFENQSVGFIEGFTNYPPALYFKILIGILVVSWAVVIWKRAWSGVIAKAIISIAFSIIAWMAIRNLAIFGIVAIPIIASNLSPLITSKRGSWINRPRFALPLIVATTIGLFFINPTYFTERQSGIGLISGINNASQFIKETKLKGPIFNNYDIGGYLIYALYPNEKVFVDNRPEAYPTSFFQDVYIPMQQDPEIWNEQLEKYQFNAIIFYRHEQTEWGQKLLVDRFEDPVWAPIYVDKVVIIFARRNEGNQSIINEFELPNKKFRVRRQ